MRMTIMALMKFFIPIFLLFTLVSDRRAFGSEQVCARKNLNFKNCVFKNGELKMSVSGEKIRYNHERWTSIVDFPKSNIVTSWEDVRIYTFGIRQFLSLKVWEQEDDEIPLEELRWVLFEPKGKKLVERVNELLGKRQGKRASGEKLIQDQLKQTSLSFNKKSNEIVWVAGKKTGVIKDGL